MRIHKKDETKRSELHGVGDECDVTTLEKRFNNYKNGEVQIHV